MALKIGSQDQTPPSVHRLTSPVPSTIVGGRCRPLDRPFGGYAACRGQISVSCTLPRARRRRRGHRNRSVTAENSQGRSPSDRSSVIEFIDGIISWKARSGVGARPFRPILPMHMVESAGAVQKGQSLNPDLSPPALLLVPQRESASPACHPDGRRRSARADSRSSARRCRWPAKRHFRNPTLG